MFLLLTAGCVGASSPVRHLSSDICLVMPEQTTREEVISFLGEPDRKMTTDENLELWLYLEVNRSFARKMPLVGDKLGTQNYEAVTVTFNGELVSTCLYRQFDESEFEKFNTELP
ncbi:MAG: hypothetical protein RQ753_06770 [Desulfurivibrionaceae bacterium]|nr:hypothetical protein [Desulfobulbales bacterium]MDT8335382.1 hypothetical protein [Desulfurivibrionaceae bacterium]